MLDTETWGTEPGCDGRSIGACVFDPVAGQIGNKFYLALDNPNCAVSEQPYKYWDEHSKRRYKYPLTRDPKTVQWWSEQSDEAQAAFADPVDLRDGLIKFTQWYSALDLQDVNGGNHGIRLWAHGPQFDVVIVAAWYRAVGLPVPWHYRAPRDTRTIMEAAGMDPHKGLEMFSTGTHHNALGDAICQARAVCAAYKVIRSGQAASGDPSAANESC